MSTEHELSKLRVTFMLTSGPGEPRYTFHYGHKPVELMCELTVHREGEEPELLGSAFPLRPIGVGKTALLGVDTPTQDMYILETKEITDIGRAPDEFQP